MDIVGNPFDKYQEIAHLLPAGKQAHEEWFGVAAAVMGLSETASVCEQLMATRGVRKEYTDDQDDDAEDGKPTPVHLQTDNTRKASRRAAAAASSKQPEKAESRSRGRRGAAAASKQPENPRKSSSPPAEKKRSPLARDTKKRKGDGLVAAARTKKKRRAPVQFDETTISQDSTRSSLARKLLMDHTGVIHFVFNKLRLQQQGKVMDGTTPLLLIVPCMTLQEAKGWRGEGYKALVLAGFPDGITNIPQDYLEDASATVDAKRLASEAFMHANMTNRELRHRYENSIKVSPEEKARHLEKARTGLEQAVLGLTEYLKGMKKRDLKDLQHENQTKLKERSQSLPGQVAVPKTRAPLDKPVLFVDFGILDQAGTHPAPDPVLLLSKAANVWGTMTGFTILANGQLADDEDCESMDEAAEEDFCMSFRNSALPIPKEISVVSPYAVAT